ncbi:transmembrane protein 186-like [Anneissia japonica]|uniref:transmembrane protein 186-like n=1 Tax=Anneissia japonica TaxID=1529436 RepID=UPI0014254B91|nr:transmembrane protein 186-like [Anneissia japonica]XP_033108771.1 transmembrane protein 186-like [Anneissia japonica]XP_033108772.1 transmembrane protein 186-like [Anneissia japonica]
MLHPSRLKHVSLCFIKKRDRSVNFATTRLLSGYHRLQNGKRTSGRPTTLEVTSVERALYYHLPRVQVPKQLISQTSITNPHFQERHPSASGNDVEFKAIYRLPYIQHIRFLSRLKLAQTIFVVGIVPPLGILKYMDLITDAQFLFPLCAANFSLIMLYCMSLYLRRIIGVMYINQNCLKLKVSHLDFWGRRQNFVVDVKDVLSASEIGDSKEILMRKFQTFESKKYFYFSLKYGKVLNEQIFYEIFGKPETTVN